MKRYVLLSILLFLQINFRVANAQELANFSAAFVNVGIGARLAAMGEAGTALAERAEAITWNPAGIAASTNWQAIFSYTKLYGMIPYHFAGLTTGSKREIGFGLAAVQSGDELLSEVSLYPGIAVSKQVAFGVAQFGAVVGVHSAHYGNDEEETGAISGGATGFSLSVGARFLFLENKIVIGSVWQNAYNQIRWSSKLTGEYSQRMPMEWRLGLAVLGNFGFTFAVDYRPPIYKDVPERLYLGSEWRVHSGIFLRAGTAASLQNHERVFYSLGMGICQRELWWKIQLRMDIAYVIDPISNSLRLSLAISPAESLPLMGKASAQKH